MDEAAASIPSQDFELLSPNPAFGQSWTSFHDCYPSHPSPIIQENSSRHTPALVLVIVGRVCLGQTLTTQDTPELWEDTWAVRELAKMLGRGKGKIRVPRRAAPYAVGRSIQFPARSAVAEDLDGMLRVVEGHIMKILRDELTYFSFEDAYRSSYKVVLKKKGAELLETVEKTVSEETKRQLQSIFDRELAIHGDTLHDNINLDEKQEAITLIFSPLEQVWQRYLVRASMISDMCMYLDRVNLVDEGTSLYDIITKIFGSVLKDILHASSDKTRTIQDLFTGIILEGFDRDRRGDLVDRNSMKQFVQSLKSISATMSDMGPLFDILESALLDSSRIFYKEESNIWLQHATAGAYCRQTMQRLRDEEQRCRLIMGDSTAVKMTAILGQELVIQPMEKLARLDTGAAMMAGKARTREIELLTELVDRFCPSYRNKLLELSAHREIVPMA